jgi:phosphoribosylanthranilate isomerase
VSLADARALVRSVPPYVAAVAVMVNPAAGLVETIREWGLVPQFSGDETPEFCAAAGRGRYVKALHFEAGTSYTAQAAAAMAERYPDADLLFDSRSGALYGGTGTSFEWPLVESIARSRRVIVGGGLTPDNVGAAVASVRPFGVDVRSGVERGAVKDRALMRAFVRAVRALDDEGTSLAKT